MLDVPVLPPPTHLEFDGVTVATRILQPDGPSRGDVVLCHGTPWSSFVWSHVAADLSRDHRVHLWDMPGYGNSAKGAGVTTDLATQAKRLVALLEVWGLERPHLVAHDIGGAVTLRAHLLHQVEVADLFLWDIVTLDPWGSPFFRLVAEHTEVFTSLPPAIHAAVVREYIAGAAHRSLTPAVHAALAEPWLDPVGQAAFYGQIASLTPSDTGPVVDRLGETRAPVRLGWGLEDPWIPADQAPACRPACRERHPSNCSTAWVTSPRWRTPSG